MGEEFNSKGKKKVIKVSKAPRNNDIPNQSESVHRHSSCLSVASNFNKIFSSERLDGSTELEEELQVIDLEQASVSSKHPIEIMFPHFTQDGVDLNNLTRTMPATDLTKLLIGHKPRFTNIRSQKRRRDAIDFTARLERTENESSFESTNKGNVRKSNENYRQRPRLDSADAEDSDAEDSDAEDT